jgi:hypothetical protein
MRRLLFALVLLSACAFAQSHAKRLILKDGTYQSITDYKVQGANVHYYSAERYGWEDIPSALIDWDATNKFNANPVKNDESSASRDAADEDAAEDAKSEAQAPTVAPRLRLPDAQVGGVYLLDQWKDRPELAEILQSGADVADVTRKDILRLAVGGAHKSIELPGAHAKVQSHVTTPTIFLCVETGDKGVDLANHYRLIRVQFDAKKNTRSAGAVITKISGKTSETQKFVPATPSKVNDGPWVKITPNQPLEPGEYAVVEMLGTEMNLYVWDFGVNPNAPENVNPQLPLPERRLN